MADVKKLVDKSKAKKKGGALVSMKEIEKMYAMESRASAEAAPIAGGVPVISTKGEQFQIGENLLPDEIEVIVVAEGLINAYYDSPYEEGGENRSPACFAVALAEKGVDSKITSHESSPNRQGGKEFKCQGCEMNKFGTAERGKGKACGNRRRLAVVFADDPALKAGEGDLTWGFLNLPPTSLGDWGKFVTGLDKVEHRPPHGVVTKFAFDRKNKNANLRKRVIAIGYQRISDPSTAMMINKLRKDLIDNGSMVTPLPVDGYVEPGSKPPVVAKGRAAPAKKRAAVETKAPAKGAAKKRAAGF